MQERTSKIYFFYAALKEIMILFCLFSCVQNPNTTRSILKQQAAANTSNDPAPDSPAFGDGVSEDISFFTKGQTPLNITLNANTQDIIFLRGNNVHKFLSSSENFSRKYCLVVNYNVHNVVRQLRFLAVPSIVNGPPKNTEEKLYRIELTSKETNQQLCSNVVGTTSDIGFLPREICQNCSGIIASTPGGVKLHIVQGTQGILDDVSGMIPAVDLDTTALGMRIDITSSTVDSNSSCTNVDCINQDFDCCLDGQCVTDGKKKNPTVSAFLCLEGALQNPQDLSHCSPDLATVSNIYGQAFSDTQSNSIKFAEYPGFFFVCSNIDRKDPTPIEPPDAQAVALALLLQDIKDLNCLTGATATVQDLSECSPTPDAAGLTAVQEKTWQRCGCVVKASSPPPNDPATLCPAFGLKGVFDIGGNITDVICLNPPPLADPVPSQFLNINISGRRAPHRFFKQSDGSPVNDLAAAIDDPNFVTFSQEGEEFRYQNESSKVGPVSGSFNINALLGSFSLNLNRALPAKMIAVHPATSYYVFATKGTYTPCAQCDDDAWFNAFSAHPSSDTGRGLSSIGFITNRESYQNNITTGNYEDTLFGRACWLPPTMIPFSHKKYASAQEQRQNRLSTQAAFYINGYQRDWYGFNKGAIIGSFDGVSWFAIGSGRKITTRTNKLYIAINAPYADLADTSTTVVQVVEDLGRVEDEAPAFDFVPGIKAQHPNQNDGASCQQHHQCDSDADCITQLGWEYRCANITDYSSKLPSFDLNANELANDEIENASFSTIITPFPAGDLNRCVYRGAGAICHESPETLSEGRRDLFTCAPNFYCANVSNNDFNNEVYRETINLTNIIFGQEADVLGRPKNYLNASFSLPDEVIDNIKGNASLHTNTVNNIGICRPGKKLSLDTRIQHANKDVSGRTDYISQISSCDSNAVGDSRVQTCPFLGFDEDNEDEFGNYLDINPATLGDSTGFFKAAHIQNSCGQEAQTEFVINNPESSFKNIEAEKISSLFDLIQPKIAQDACYRRAGSVCHTDLDCLPGRLHQTEAGLLGQLSFGDTEAEKKFWEEALVCGQAQRKPALSAPEFDTYDMTLNRCCREIGSELTMFTQVGVDTQLDPDIGIDNNKLNTGLFPYNDPKAEGRYSRYVSAQPSSSVINFAARSTPISQTPAVANAVVPQAFQWKTLNDTGRRTCCGKGWIRKFSDGGHNWSNLNRLRFNVEAFSCLNYDNELYLKKYANISAANYSHDYGSLCLVPNTKGCIQKEITKAAAANILRAPSTISTTGFIDTSPTEDPDGDGGNGTCGTKQATDLQGLYQPIPYTPKNPFNPTSPRTNCFHINNRKTTLGSDDHGIAIYLPLYIGGKENIISIKVKKFIKDTLLDVGSDDFNELLPSGPGNCEENMIPQDMPNGALGDNIYCIFTDSDGLEVLYAKVAHTNPADWEYAGLVIKFKNPGSIGYIIDSAPISIDAPSQGLRAGNDMYYLTKLARFELLGIPQIYYEPLYCNDNNSKLVEDIFDLNQQTRGEFDTNSFFHNNANGVSTPEDVYDENYDSVGDLGNPNGNVVFQDKVALNRVFSGNQFLCCQQLGERSDNKNLCCSNHLKLDEGSDVEGACALPQGTDLYVYFNKFVSGDGMGDDQPGGGLSNEDFIPETGEPKARESTSTIMKELGKAYCDSGLTRPGVAFGNFTPEPNAGFFAQEGGGVVSYYSIIDTPGDYDPDEDAGTLRFNEGFRWNHHLYCAPISNNE